jgi:L-rhamnose mutarotase
MKGMGARRICMACDLKDDPQLIDDYKRWHSPGKVWPEIKESIKEAGILDMQIYLIGNRLFMIMEVDPSFDMEKKAEMDTANPKVQEWEALMMKYQQFLPFKGVKSKWVEMDKIFSL